MKQSFYGAANGTTGQHGQMMKDLIFMGVMMKTVTHKKHKKNILTELKRAGKRGLTTWELVLINPTNYRARISELRKDGYDIPEAKRVYDSKNRYLGYSKYVLREETVYDTD